MARKSEERDRRARVAELQRQERAKERRRNLLLVGGAGVVAVGLVAAAAVPLYSQWRDDPANRDWGTFGVAAAAAACQPVTDDAAAGTSDHRDTGRLTYTTSPPSSGPHRSLPAAFSRKFYAPGTAPELEQLVHNLEHGYTVLWYSPDLADDQRTEVEQLARKVSEDEGLRGAVAGKFVAAPWDAARGAFPDGTTVALSHWGREQGHRQYCGQLSGEAVRDFAQAHPFSDSPEPNGA